MKKLNQQFIFGSFSLLASHASASPAVTQVSEPATLSLICIGLLGLGLARRKVKSSDKN